MVGGRDVEKLQMGFPIFFVLFCFASQNKVFEHFPGSLLEAETLFDWKSGFKANFKILKQPGLS